MPKLNMWFVGGWFAATTTALIFSLIFNFYLSGVRLIKPTTQNFNLYAAIPKSEASVSDDISFADGRSRIIEEFFKKHKAPLSAHGNTFIEIADRYQLDWRLLPSIAMQESNGGKKVIRDSFNPFGYGIYGKLVIRFKSWDEAIERVGKALKEDYLNQGLKTPVQIMAKYTPPSLAKNGAWASGVSAFIEELR
ncbi:glucosaminidase domain-containing protein [Candidatus Daviesbacteria bacterium]|nr:glucosaminidase domain-containing protein [Candidatus Daviesbacteria bacterium]